MRERVIGLDRNGVAKGSSGFIGLAERHQRAAQVVMQVGRVRCEAERCAVARHRLGQLALTMQRCSQVGVRIDKVGLVRERPAVAFDCFIELALRLERVAAVVVTMRIAASLVHSRRLEQRNLSAINARAAE
jgi:hypothetical protein